MDAGQIIMMPPTGAAVMPVGTAEAPVAQSELAGLFGEILDKSLLNLQETTAECCALQSTEFKSASTANAVDVTDPLLETELESDPQIPSADPTVALQFLSTVQMAFMQPPQQFSQLETAVTSHDLEAAGAELSGVAEASALVSSEELVADDPSLFAEKVAPEKVVDPQTFVLRQERHGREVAPVVSASEQAGGSVQLKPKAELVAPPEVPVEQMKQVASVASEAANNRQAAGSEARSKGEVQSALQELAGASKNTPTVVSQPVRFAQQPDIVAAVAEAEGKRNGVADQLSQNVPLVAKLSEGQVVHEEALVTEPKTVVGAVTSSTIEQHVAVMHGRQQSAGLSEAAAVAEPTKASPQEPVMRQVADNLLKHEIKQGSDQISFRLSPENLGNLQLNMRMEDQRLRLEIVAENRGVRDILLQQADELKETLARQNIKVETFNVTTGGQENLFQQSADWRQAAAEQRRTQPQQYAASQGWSGIQDGAAVRYFAPQYQSTIDVRF